MSDFLLSGKMCMNKTMSERPGVGVLHQIFGRKVRHTIKKWTQSDLKFCKNERSKTNEKGCQLDKKWDENRYKMENINAKFLKLV